MLLVPIHIWTRGDELEMMENHRRDHAKFKDIALELIPSR